MNDWYSPDVATFGDRVAAAREQANMTQAQLAKRLGVKPSTMSKWEEDLSEPRANRLSMLAGLLNVSIMWLINGDGEGIETPPDEQEVAGNLRDVLTELREVRADMLHQAARVARLEKRLRGIVREGEGRA